MKRFIIAALLVLMAPAGTLNGAKASPQAVTVMALKTKPEATNFEQTSHYEEVVAFVNELAKAAPKVIKLKTFGTTIENRALPLVVVGASDPTPETVRRTGKLRVYIQGNIHGGEVEGKESAQILLRELAAGKHEDWLKTMVLLVAPIYNADGNERFSLTSRGRQHGPLGGQGQRPNAQGLDLNRDHMKLESPEARAFVKLMNDYDPQVSMDLHTTNGTRHAYYLTYSPPLNPSTDPTITTLLRNTWFPWLTTSIRTKYGWDYYYYGNVEGARGATGERAWRSFDHRPRFNNNYIGLRNRFALLSEAFAYASFKDRITATNRFVEESLDFITQNASRIGRIVTEADQRKVVDQRLGLRAEMVRGPALVDVLMGEVTQEKHPVDGHIMELRKNVKIPEKMADYGTFEATETERVPMTYYVPPDYKEAIDLLTAHGIRLQPLRADASVDAEEFQIATNTQAANAFQNHRERTLTGKWVAAKRSVPAGTLTVRMDQPLARLAFYLLEPRSDDGLVDWNVLDAALGPDAKTYPILRSVK